MSSQLNAGDLLKILGPLLAGSSAPAPNPSAGSSVSPAPPPSFLTARINGVTVDLAPFLPLVSKLLSGGGIGTGELLAAAPAIIAIVNASRRPRPGAHVPPPPRGWDERDSVDGVPDDKIIPPPMAVAAIDRLGLAIKMAQYNRELFPEQYTEDNQFGLYKRPDIDAIFKDHSRPLSRRSKAWFDVSPFVGQRKVEEREGADRGILWGVVYHLVGPGGGETVVRDGGDSPDGRVQIVDPDASGIGIGVTNWRSTNGYGLQINVGEQEGAGYRVWAELPKLGLTSNVFEFAVS